WLPKLTASVAGKFSGQVGGHRIRVDFPEDFPMVRGDERRLTQVLNNLVSNAIKYSPDGTEIDTEGDVRPGYVMVSVRDQGIGTPQQEEPRIFERFTRLASALSRKPEGSGLASFLTKAIIEAHDGRIWCNSTRESSDGVGDEAQKSGTTFTFCLPRDGR